MASHSLENWIISPKYWYTTLLYEVVAVLIGFWVYPSVTFVLLAILFLIQADILAKKFVEEGDGFAKTGYGWRMLMVLPPIYLATIQNSETLRHLPLVVLALHGAFVIIGRMFPETWKILLVDLALILLYYTRIILDMEFEEGSITMITVLVMGGSGTMIFYLFYRSSQEVEDKLLSAESANAFINFRIQIAMHDLLNKVHALNACYYLDDLNIVLDRIEKFQSESTALIKSMRIENKERLEFNDLVSHLSKESEEFDLRFTSGEPQFIVWANKKSILDVVHNLIENAVEAGLRKQIKPEIHIEVEGNLLWVHDNCGGFDPQTAVSAKGTGHGVFYREILMNSEIQRLLGYEVFVNSRLGVGTSILLKFSRALPV